MRFIVIVMMIFLSPSTLYAVALPDAFTRAGLRSRIELTAYLHREVNRPMVKILDVGTAQGTFLLRIKDYFESLGYQAHVTGIDDGQILQGGTELIDHWADIANSKGVSYHKLSIQQVSERPERFDFVFLNSPYQFDGQISRLVRASLKVLRPDGLLFVRLFLTDQNSHFIHQIESVAQDEGIQMVQLPTRLPKGQFDSSDWTYVFKKTEFKSEGQAFGASLGKLADVIFNQNELGRAA